MSDAEQIRERQAEVSALAHDILTHPVQWGVLEPVECEALAARLLEMRNRVRSCRIAEAAEVASL